MPLPGQRKGSRERLTERTEGQSAAAPQRSPESHSRNQHTREDPAYSTHVPSSASHTQGPQHSHPTPITISHHARKDLESSASPSPSPERSLSSAHHRNGGQVEREREREKDSSCEGSLGRTDRTNRAGCIKREKWPHLPSPLHQTQGSWGDEVVLLVDRQRFPINPRIFMKYPNTMLGRMFGSSMENQLTLKPNDRGEYEVARGVTAGLFRAVLDYYHYGVISCPSSESMSELRETCDYLMIPFNEKTIKTHNISDFLNELSNDGARAQFEKYLQTDLLQAMVQCAQKGERECQIVILMEDDVIDWDDDYPPSVGEDHIERVTNSELCRFFKYFENRDIAKDALRDKGLKKIRIGIEGYPTTKEKVRVRAHTGRTEVVYNYVQRPFLRMSWEKDEAKSRHVDFTCVKIKTDIAPDAEAATLLSGNEDNFDY